MRTWILVGALITACGTDAPATAVTPSPSTAPASTTASATAPVEVPPSPADPADCARVAPCAEAFAAVAPAELGGPARVAAEQLDRSLAESPARAAACTAAMVSFRADLARLELEVPEACRVAAPAGTPE